MKYTEKQVFMCSKIQKQTLQNLHKKYKINISQFIRDAIKEKIERDSCGILKNHKDILALIKKLNDCPF